MTASTVGWNCGAQPDPARPDRCTCCSSAAAEYTVDSACACRHLAQNVCARCVAVIRSQAGTTRCRSCGELVVLNHVRTAHRGAA